ncbi:MAG: hypothetical protein P1P88_15320 [Bacteroidales bacterium]|nr:hypothetical protein [Bacteroidales bacterium]
MKEILRSQWDFMLCEKDGDLLFSVICGTIGIFEVNILLNAEEIENYNKKGDEYLKELAEQSRYSPKSYNDRHIDINYITK